MTCAKQRVIAIIENNGQAWIGENKCKSPQEECPRNGMETGVGYDLCKSVCQQENHAEVDACLKAGTLARGGTMTIIGHIYCCEHCSNFMRAHGIKRVVFSNEAP